MRRVSLHKKGSSLLSILATITIACILVTLIVSVFSKIMDASRAASCTSNLRQIGVALQLYLAEHDGRYPPNRANPAYKTEKNPAGVYHQDSLKVYLTPYPDKGTITAKMAGPFWCPADADRKYEMAQHSYGANTYIGNDDEEQNIRREASPSQRLYLVDATRETLSTCMFSHIIWPFNNGPLDAPNTDIRVDFRHAGRAKGLFLDGHVATFTVEDLRGQDPRTLIPSP